MINTQLISYIKLARDQKISDSEIEKNLTEVGWNTEAIQKALKLSDQPDIPLPHTDLKTQPQQSTHAPNQNSMWDAFEHILLFITLYVLGTSTALILYYFVDKWVPGITEDGYNTYARQSQLSTLRSSIAAAIVSYPLFAFFFLRVTKRTIDNPHIRNLKSRKFLIYLTLVLTFLIVIGNVIRIVYNFLSGNITANFILSFLVTISISGIIFLYYLNQIKEDRKIYA
jgi:hypothetical protein